MRWCFRLTRPLWNGATARLRDCWRLQRAAFDGTAVALCAAMLQVLAVAQCVVHSNCPTVCVELHWDGMKRHSSLIPPPANCPQCPQMPPMQPPASPAIAVFPHMFDRQGCSWDARSRVAGSLCVCLWLPLCSSSPEVGRAQPRGPPTSAHPSTAPAGENSRIWPRTTSQSRPRSSVAGQMCGVRALRAGAFRKLENAEAARIGKPESEKKSGPFLWPQFLFLRHPPHCGPPPIWPP